MHLLPIIAAAPALAAAAVAKTRSSDQLIQLQWHFDKTTAEVALSIMDESHNQTFAHVCGSAITSGVFSSLPISVDVDDNAEGTVSVGDVTYKVHSLPEFSGGIVCDTVYTPRGEALINCRIPISGDLKLEAISTDSLPNCFSSESVPGLGRGLGNMPTTVGAIARRDGPLSYPAHTATRDVAAADVNEGDLEKRQCGVVYSRGILVGNGNPHMNHFHKQISENIDCGNGECSVSWSSTRSFSISATFGGALWISGGFGVTYTWETGNQYTCYAGRGERVCNWYDTAHTAYTVRQEFYSGQGCPKAYGDPYIIWSPNINNRGGGHYCVRGVNYCRSLGDGYWDYTAYPA